MNLDRLDELPDRYAVEAKNFAAGIDQLSLARENMNAEDEDGSGEKAEWSAEDVKAELEE